jgi:DNA mismatch repair protein MSH5
MSLDLSSESSRSHLLAVHELGQLLDEEMTEAETNDLKEAEMVCRRFMAWNLEETEKNANGKDKLAKVLAREVD